MKNESEQLEALQDIRKMMKESSRFLSLSGLSGVLAGIFALCGAYVTNGLIESFHASSGEAADAASYDTLVVRVFIVSITVLALSVTSALLMSAAKARKSRTRLFDHASKKVMWSMLVPLLAGGIFCLFLVKTGGDHLYLICPVMLIFYGLALAASSSFTLNDVKYLGYMNIALGLTALFYREHGLLFWTLGFGALHIVYGSIMWFKYDRTQHQ